jgi:hypothetical protein
LGNHKKPIILNEKRIQLMKNISLWQLYIFIIYHKNEK